MASGEVEVRGEQVLLFGENLGNDLVALHDPRLDAPVVGFGTNGRGVIYFTGRLSAHLWHVNTPELVCETKQLFHAEGAGGPNFTTACMLR